MNVLWRGRWTARLRIGSGLVLFTYAFFHFLNIALGLAGPAAMDAMQEARQIVTRSLVGTVLIYGAFLVHAALALWKLAGRRTLKLPAWQLAQIVLGLAIPVFLIVHVVHTRGAHELYDVNDRMAFVIGLIWDTPSGWNQALLLLLVWLHGCIGLHYWLRLNPWWPRALPWAVAVAVLIPAAALAGYLAEGRRMAAVLADPDGFAAAARRFNWPDAATFDALTRLTDRSETVFWALLLLALAAQLGLRLVARRRGTVRIRYVDGPELRSPPGPTLLEISRANRVPHMALCGGRGRCTTCRVIVEDGADLLEPPSEAEQRSLAAVGAAPGTRLACQMRPRGQTTVFRVFRPGDGRMRSHASQGRERRLAVLFLDMRGFTARTAGQLPYDVLFLLNRFFDAIVPPILRAGGTVDKYLGDGLLAVFDLPDARGSARAALKAAAGIGTALEAFNQTLTAEGEDRVRIGLGLHLGTLVLGEIGAAGHAPRTIIGDTVNVASRLEAATKEHGALALISSELLAAAGAGPDDDGMLTLTLRGVADPVAALPLADPGDLAAILADLD